MIDLKIVPQKIFKVILKFKTKIKSSFYLNEKEFNYLGFSSFDAIGKVFEYKGNIYRGIYKEKEDYVLTLFKTGFIKKLIDKEFIVNTNITELKSKSFNLIIRHEKITYSEPTLWTPEMFRKVAVKILELNTLCEENNYQLVDAHPYNIAFKANKPYWLDLGSFMPKSQIWNAKTEFINSTIVPLVLLLNNYSLEAYSLLISLKYVKTVVNDFKKSIYWDYFLKIIKVKESDFHEELITIDWIKNLSNKLSLEKSRWANYQTEEDVLMTSKNIKLLNTRFKRFKLVKDLINSYCINCSTILDLAGSSGLLSRYLSNNKKYKKVINTDYDTLSVERSFELSVARNESVIENYILNFMLPSYDSAYKNLKSDIVLALAISHHLLLTQNFKLDHILSSISKYSNKYVVIEFMPLGLWGGDKNSLPEIPEWYTEEWFDCIFKKQFSFIMKETIESHIINGENKPHRVLYIGKIKK